MDKNIWNDLSVKQQRAVLYCLENPGASKKDICDYIEVSYTTLQNWDIDNLVKIVLLDVHKSAVDLMTNQMHAALRALVNHLESEDEVVQFRAARLILEYSLGKPEQISRIGNIKGESFGLNIDFLRDLYNNRDQS